VGLPAEGARASVNDGRRLFDRPLDVFGLPLLVAFVCQVAAAKGSFDLDVGHTVRESVNREGEVNAGAVAGVPWVRAKVVDASQNSRHLLVGCCGSASFALLAITVELSLCPGDESVCFWVG
jgi:hypothetical protein